METTTSIEKRLSSPTLLRDTKTSDRQIRETVNLPSGAWVGIEGKGLIRVNSTLYNLKYYELLPSDSTQKGVIQKALRQILPHTSKTIHTPKTISTIHTVDVELNNIVLLDRLVKKVTLWNSHKEKAKTTTDEDKFILLGRQLKRDRQLIDSMLSTLRQDSCFSIRDNFIHYNGNFANCKRLIPEGGL